MRDFTARIAALGSERQESVLRFLLCRVTPEVRLALMAEMPVAYGVLYPWVKTSLLIERVTTRVESERA